MDKLTIISGCLFLAADIFAIASIANPDWINTGESAGERQTRGGRGRVVKGEDPAEEKWLRGEETWTGLSSSGLGNRVRGDGRPTSGTVRNQLRAEFFLKIQGNGKKYLEETEAPVKEFESWRGGWGRSEVACGRGKAQRCQGRPRPQGSCGG